ERLNKKVSENLSANQIENLSASSNLQCPRCHDTKLVSGCLSEGRRLYFRPSGLGIFTFFASDIVLQESRYRGPTTACCNCGIVFKNLDSVSLKKFIARHGRRKTIEKLKLDTDM